MLEYRAAAVSLQKSTFHGTYFFRAVNPASLSLYANCAYVTL